MAPEQFRDAKNADVRCDIYSLGATLYMMVTGQVPFAHQSPLDCFLKKLKNELPAPREVKPELSERVDWAIRRAMSGSTDQRPGSCREFVEDLYGRSTRPQSSMGPVAAEGDLWYLVWQDELGQRQTVKGATDGIRRALKEGLLGDASNIVACRKKDGPFVSLRTFPEFRDLVIEPEPLPTPTLNPKSTPTSGPVPPSGRWPDPLRTTPPRPGPSPSGRLATPADADAATLDQPPLSARHARPVGESSNRLPHLRMETGRRSGWYDVFIWTMVLAVALITALAAFFFFPPS
jgi:serine/threonine protein kinase